MSLKRSVSVRLRMRRDIVPRRYADSLCFDEVISPIGLSPYVIMPHGGTWFTEYSAGTYEISLSRTIKGPRIHLGDYVSPEEEIKDYWQ